jgi:hypothetical protein
MKREGYRGVLIHVPTAMKEWLEKQAARNLRSQNAEIVLALRDKMESQQQAKAAS